MESHSRSKTASVKVVLIVVVSIAVLIALLMVVFGLANFKAAQNRSKVARTKADLRSIATALEMYRLDNESYPPQLNSLTGPMVYVEAKLLADMFAKQGQISYWTGSINRTGEPESYFVIWSVGPDGKPDLTRDSIAQRLTKHLESFSDVTYNPVNGARSAGDLIRTKE